MLENDDVAEMGAAADEEGNMAGDDETPAVWHKS